MKIVLVGLANVGKTTIVKRTFEGYTIGETKNILPTILKEVSVFNNSPLVEEQITICDLGGQTAFLDTHLNEDNFINQDLVIFVVNVQQINEYDQNISYFTKIQSILQNLPNESLVSIFLHKYDPILIAQLHNTTKKYIQFFSSYFETPIKKLQIFCTSVFDSSLIQAMLGLILQITHDKALLLGLNMINLPNILPDLNKCQTTIDSEQYIRIMGSRFAQKVKDTWFQLILKSKKPTKIIKKGNLVYNLSDVEKNLKIIISNDNIPFNQYYDPNQTLSMYFKEFLSAFYLNVKIDLVQTGINVVIDPESILTA